MDSCGKGTEPHKAINFAQKFSTQLKVYDCSGYETDTPIGIASSLVSMQLDATHTTETLVTSFDKNSMFLKLSLIQNNNAILLNNTKILVGDVAYDLKAHQGNYNFQ